MVVLTVPFGLGGWILVVQGCLEDICFVVLFIFFFSWVALMVGFLEVDNGEFGVVFEGVEGFMA